MEKGNRDIDKIKAPEAKIDVSPELKELLETTDSTQFEQFIQYNHNLEVHTLTIPDEINFSHLCLPKEIAQRKIFQANCKAKGLFIRLSHSNEANHSALKMRFNTIRGSAFDILTDGRTVSIHREYPTGKSESYYNFKPDSVFELLAAIQDRLVCIRGKQDVEPIEYYKNASFDVNLAAAMEDISQASGVYEVQKILPNISLGESVFRISLSQAKSGSDLSHAIVLQLVEQLRGHNTKPDGLLNSELLITTKRQPTGQLPYNIYLASRQFVPGSLRTMDDDLKKQETLNIVDPDKNPELWAYMIDTFNIVLKDIINNQSVQNNSNPK